jgi:peptide/nickel transport system substrate-binding protein
MLGKIRPALILILILALSLSLLAACGGGDEDEAGTGTAQEAAPTQEGAAPQTQPQATESQGQQSGAAASAAPTAAAAGATSAPAAGATPVSSPAPQAGAGITVTRAPEESTGETGTQYTAAAKLLMEGGPKALAEANGESPRYGGKFLANNWEPIPFYDMHQTSFGGVYVITAPAYNGMLATSPYDPLAAEIIPDLALSWDISDGGATVNFHLAEGVTWHDGTPFSAEDVKWTIERIKNPPEGMVSPRQGVFRGTVESVEVIDANTLQVKSEGFSPLLVPLFSNGWNAIIPKHISEVDPVNAMMTQVVGTGAFRLMEPPTTTVWRYERNPVYFDENLPYLDEIEYHIIQDPQAQAAALRTKKVYFNDSIGGINFSPELAQSVDDQEEGLTFHPVPTITVSHFVMNGTRPPFDDVRVRQAISEAIHRGSIADLGPQAGTVGTGNFPLGPWALPQEMQESLIGYGPDMEVRIANAERLLAEYESENGEIDWDSMTIQCSSNLTWSCPNGEVAQQHLKRIGITSSLEPLDVTAHRGNEVSGDYFMSTLAAGMDFDDPNDTFGQWFITNGGRWYQRRSIPELDEIFNQQKGEGDFEVRRALVWEMDQIAMNDASYMILQWLQANFVKWDFLKGITATANPRTTNARLKYTWLDLPEANRTSR